MQLTDLQMNLVTNGLAIILAANQIAIAAKIMPLEIGEIITGIITAIGLYFIKKPASLNVNE